MHFDDPKIQAEYDAMIARRPSRNGVPPSPPPQPVVVPDKLLDRLRASPTAAFEAVLGRLTHKIGQKEPVANCPFHEDRHPSLRVNLDKLACFCDPCGRGWGIVDLAKEVWNCDFKEAARRLAPDDRPKPVPVRTIRYPVRDLEGELKATHIRHEFADRTKSMPWEPSGIKVSELPLFQIEKTADSGDGEAVIVCEGEKAALKLWEQDRTLAVGTVTGSAHVPCDESLKPLLRLTVYLWPDHDDPGYEHMRKVGEKLLGLGHTDVWKIKWPSAPEKGDAADYHGDVGALLDSAERFTSVPALPTNGQAPAKTEEFELPAVLNREIIDIWTWSQMHEHRNQEPHRTIVDGWLFGREISSWAGKVEHGKTTLMRELTMCVIRGQPFLGRKTTRGKVFYAMLDADGEDLTYDEFKKLGFGSNSQDEERTRFIFEPNIAHMKNGPEQFFKYIFEWRPDIVIIDPFARLKAIVDFNDYDTTYLMGQVNEYAKRVDAHFCLPGHIPRGRPSGAEVASAAFGSIAFSAGMNARFVVERKPATDIHVLYSSKGKSLGFQPVHEKGLVLRRGDDLRLTATEGFSFADQAIAHKRAVREFLLERKGEWFRTKAVAAGLDGKPLPGAVGVALKMVYEDELENRKIPGYTSMIDRHGEGVRGSPFEYRGLEDGQVTEAEQAELDKQKGKGKTGKLL